MKSQDKNYMPEVVSLVSCSYGKIFIFELQWWQTATGKLPSVVMGIWLGLSERPEIRGTLALIPGGRSSSG